MKSCRRYVPLAVMLTVAAVLLPAIASSATSTETVHALAPYSWSPSAATVTPGGAIAFKNESGINHGIIWTGGTAGATPACNTGVGDDIPIGAGKWSTSWSGSCTFSKAGTYTYECSFHMALMRGTVTATVPGAPAATTGSATAIGETEATLNGTVNPEGKATSYFFNYGTSSSYGSKTGELPAGEGIAGTPVSSALSALSPGTTYHFQLVAKNGAATTLGEDRTFTTSLPPGSPKATTGLATTIGETSATLQGTVNPDGFATSYFFEWGTGGSYEHRTATLPAGEDHLSHSVSAALSGLAAGESYDFRIVAENTSGSVTGSAQVFTTTSAPTPTPTTTSSTPAPTPTPPSGAGAPGAPLGLGTTAGTVSAISVNALLASVQHGGTVRGTIEVPAAESGARLEVVLLTRAASLAKAKRSGSTRVGRLVRSSVAAGKVQFAVSLDAAGKRALRRTHKLALTVRMVITPEHGAAVTITRSVVAHA